MAAPLDPIAQLRNALVARDRDGANQAVEHLLAIGAPLGGEWKRIAQLMQMTGEISLALRAIDTFIAASGNRPEAYYDKILMLGQTGRLIEARDLLARLPPDRTNPAARAYLAGNVATTLGQIDEARAALEEVVAARPGWGPAWLSLAEAINLADDPLGDRLLADRTAADAQPEADRARYYYALGRLHHDRGQHTEAFAAFTEGARLLKSVLPYSSAGDRRNAAAAMSGFGPGTIESWNARQTLATDRPIVVTGLPRSGTTLVEQIVTSHSRVADGAEIGLMPQVAVTAGGNSGEAIQAYFNAGGTIEKLARLFLHLLEERFGPNGRVIDKTVDNSRFLGLIAAALPETPLIWMRRDPLDAAWSCFRTFFVHGIGWSCDLTEIAEHFALEDQLAAYWQDRLGARLLVVPYRALVDAPEDWTRRILTHCGLTEEEQVHRFHETARMVTTASALQVRRPINRSGIGVAEPYREFLQPFVRAYRALGGSIEA